MRASKPAVRQLPEFLAQLRGLITPSIPTVAALDDLIHNPAGTGDLTKLAQATPALAQIAASRSRSWCGSSTTPAQVDYLRNYTPDVVGGADQPRAGRRLLRRQRALRAHPADAVPVHARLLQPAADQAGLRSATRGCRASASRCPGSAVQPTPDGSAPQAVPGLRHDLGAPRTVRRLALIGAAVLVAAVGIALAQVRTAPHRRHLPGARDLRRRLVRRAGRGRPDRRGQRRQHPAPSG